MTSVENVEQKSAHSRPNSWGVDVLIGLGVVAITWMVYRPHRVRPFYVVDFAEFIPLLERGDNIFDRVGGLLGYYIGQGRFNMVSLAVLAGKWELFHLWSPGWQIARALLMVGIFVLCYVLLRRLGADKLGSLAGSSVFLWAPAASEGWIHLTMGEPLGTAIALSMSILATRYQRSAHWKRDGVLMGVCAASLVLVKELLLPLLILPIAIALMYNQGRFQALGLTPRNRYLIGTVLGGAALAFVPVILIFARADQAAYASLYGRSFNSLDGLIAIWATGLVPFDLIVAQAHLLWALAIVGFMFIVPFGWLFGFKELSSRNHLKVLLFIAITLPLAGVLVYLPNPWYARFYFLPYLIGAGILTAVGATQIRRVTKWGTSAVCLSWLAMALVALGSAFDFAAQREATQHRDDQLITFVADSIEVDKVFFATVRPPREEWVAEESATGAPRGYGSAIRRYALATHRAWPAAGLVGCEAAKTTRLAADRIVVSFEDTCDLGPAVRTLTVSFRRIDWNRWRVVSDSTRARIIGGT